MTSSLPLQPLIWLAFHLLVGVITITASILLLRDRSPGPSLMLAGSILMTLGGSAAQAAWLLSSLTSGFPTLPRLLGVLGSLGALGWLVFGAGLLVHALRQRGLARRVSELEAILAFRRES